MGAEFKPYSKITFEFMRDGSLSPKAKAVYLSMLSHADRSSGVCWVSNKTISEETSLGITSVVSAKKELMEHRYIQEQGYHGKGSSKEYVVSTEAYAPKKEENEEFADEDLFC